MIYGNVFALKLHIIHLPSFLTMSTELMIGALRRGQTGNEILAILDAITGNESAGFDYVESPMIEQVLGVQPTQEPIVF